MLFFHSESAKTWEFIADLGTCVVIVGVAGEAIEIAAKATKVFGLKWGRFQRWLKTCGHLKHWAEWCDEHEPSLEFIGAACWALVVLGLMVEFGGNHEARRIGDSENARLNKEAA